MEENENANIICTLEDREILEQMKQAKIKKLREIETLKKKSDAIDAGCEIAKGVVTVAGAVLTVVMTICPLDGPAGEVATILASGQVYMQVLNKAIKDTQRKAKAHTILEFNRCDIRFLVQETINPRKIQPARNFKVGLDERWCDCGKF